MTPPWGGPMQPLVAAVVTAIVVLLLVSPLLAVVAFVRMRMLARELRDLQADLAGLRARVDRWTRPLASEPVATPPPVGATPPPFRPTPPPVPVPPPPVRAEAAEVRLPPPVAAAYTAAPPAPPVPPRRPTATAAVPRPPAGDFASNLGPKILAAGAGLAFVVTLGL